MTAPVVAATTVASPPEPPKTASRKRKKAAEEAEKASPPTAKPWMVVKDHKRRFTKNDLTYVFLLGVDGHDTRAN